MFIRKLRDIIYGILGLDPEVEDWKRVCKRHPEIGAFGLDLEYNLWAEYNRECLIRLFMETMMERDGLPPVKEDYPESYRLEAEATLRKAIVHGYVNPITYELLDTDEYTHIII